MNHFVLMRHECADASAKPAPHMQANSHTRVLPVTVCSAGTKAVVMRTTHARMPQIEAAR